MPAALLRPCAVQPCPALVESGACPAHTRAREQRRGTPAERGYTARWVRFRRWYLQTLNALAILGIGVGAICGGRMPEAPATTDSQCATEGLTTATRLHVDHIVPHRGNARLMYALSNLQVLCARCHSRKTATENGGFGR